MNRKLELELPPDVRVRVLRAFPAASGTRDGRVLMTVTEDVAEDLLWVDSRFPLPLSPEVRSGLERRRTVGVVACSLWISVTRAT